MLAIGVLLFHQVEELDFVEPFEVLSYINEAPGRLFCFLYQNDSLMLIDLTTKK